MGMYNFVFLKKGLTIRNGNFYAEYVEIEPNYWDVAYYFGNTKPKEIHSLHKRISKSTNASYYVIDEIQKHQPRDKHGKFISVKEGTRQRKKTKQI